MPNTLESLERLARALISDLRNAIAALSKRVAADEDSYAIQSWLIYLTMLAYDAARGAVDLYAADNTRAGIILQRQLYEYTIKAMYYLQEPSDGIKSYQVWKARHYQKLRKLRINDDLRQAIDASHAEWKRSNPEITDDYGQRNFKKMALRIDGESGYAYRYEVPSIWVHAPLAGFDVFDRLEGDNRIVSTKSTRMKPEIGIGSVIIILLRYVRGLYKIGVADDPAQYTEASQALCSRLAVDFGFATTSQSVDSSGPASET